MSTHLQRRIADFVEKRMDELGVTLQKVHWDNAEQCPLVNPLCPEDLCFLPKNHIGTAEGYHVLGTTAYDQAEHFSKKDYITDRPVTREWLIEEGWRRQRARFRGVQV